MERVPFSEYSSAIKQAVDAADIDTAHRLLLEHPEPWLELDAQLRLDVCFLLVQPNDVAPLDTEESVELINRIGWSMSGVFDEIQGADGRLTDEAFTKSGVILEWLDRHLPEEF